MRKLVLMLVIAWSMAPITAQQQVVRITTDLSALSSLFGQTISTRTECSLELSDEFGFRVPVSLFFEREVGDTVLLQTGLLLEYRPFHNRLFLTVSLLQAGVLLRDAYQEEDTRLHFINELAVGWTYKHKSGFVLEPQLIFSDPNGIYADAYQQLGNRFSNFPMTRGSLLVGWSFAVKDLEKKEACDD